MFLKCLCLICRRIKMLRTYWMISLAGFSFLYFYFRVPQNSTPLRKYGENQWIPKKVEEGALSEEELVLEKLIQADYSRIVQNFGDFGVPAYLEDIQKGERGVKEVREQYGMNVNVSDRIRYNRSLPDPRSGSCRNKKYTIGLQASVIIVFRNEPWSPLIRTLHSVINRTPHKLLKEVILVDDSSTSTGLNYNFQDKLDYYIKSRLPGFVRLIRLSRRMGVVGARLQGALSASGEVLVFLDPHTEVNYFWLQPLLKHIQANPKVVVQPVIDIIDDDTFEYSPVNGASPYFKYGVFTWGGIFEWKEMNRKEMVSRFNNYAPIKNPVMAGGIFAIDKKFFWDIGSYDDEMMMRGAENIELSIRIWTCGGSMEMIPCSRVGHVYRSHAPANREEHNTTLSLLQTYAFNIQRTAHVWWDDYARLLYQFWPEFKSLEYGNVEKRKILRQRLECKPFEWYLRHVLPKFVMDKDAVFSGRLRSDTNLCLTFGGRGETERSFAYLGQCAHQLTGKQYFALSKRAELRREYLCIFPHTDVDLPDFQVRLADCTEKAPTRWKYVQEDRTLLNLKVVLCLDSEGGRYPKLKKCDPTKPSQRWTFIDNSTLNI